MATYGRTQSLMRNKIEEMTNRLMVKLSDPSLSEEERSVIISDTVNAYFGNAISHSFTKRKLSNSSALLPHTLDDTFEEMDMDLTVLYKEILSIVDGIMVNFNYAASQKQSLVNSIKELGAVVNEYSLITQTSVPNSNVISDNFNTEKNIDKDFGSGSRAFIHTATGIATLEHKDSVNISEKGTVARIVGNGIPGNEHLIVSDSMSDITNIISANSLFLSEKDAHDEAESILDKLPSTWYEYQMLGLDQETIALHEKYTDLSWAKAKKVGDRLRLKLTIKLDGINTINWININPYLPSGSSGKLTVYSISTSSDGLIYLPIYGDTIVLNSELNTLPNTYDPNYIANDKLANSKFTSQGVWNFPARQVQYIEIVLDQEEPYKVKVGIPVYTKIIQKTTVTRRTSTTAETRLRVSETEVPIEIRNAPAGKYKLSNTEHIEKTVEEADAFRYCIGIKDVNIYQYIFATQSELVSKLYEFEKPISGVSLGVKEVIPQSIIGDIKSRNDWIKYYISTNDVEWHQISPVTHFKMGDSSIPPKAYTINRSTTLTANISSGTIVAKEDIKQIRFKAVFKRGDDSSDTPILEEYNLHITTKES